MNLQESPLEPSSVRQSESVTLRENAVVTKATRFLRELITKAKERAAESNGSYVAYVSTDGRTTEERIYLIDFGSGLRWSVGRTYIVDNPGLSSEKELESFSVNAREHLTPEPIRILARSLWIVPFLPDPTGEMGVIIASEHVEQLEPDGTKALVMFDTITQSVMQFKRIGKGYLDIEAKKMGLLDNVRTILNSESSEVKEVYSAAVLDIVEMIVKQGLLINLAEVSVQMAAKIGNSGKIRPLYPSSEQLLLQGIVEIISEMLEQRFAKKPFDLPQEAIVKIAQEIFQVLIGKWSKFFEDEHGSFIRSKIGDFEIPPLEPSLMEKVASKVSDRWAEIGRCFKSPKLTEREIDEILNTLLQLEPITPELVDLEVTESDEMLEAHRRVVNVLGRDKPIKIIPPKL